MIAVVDYGAGNLFSVKNALDFLKLENMITGRSEDLARADKLILPGVGALPDAMKKLVDSGLAEAIGEQVEKGKPLLGICLGMQMLFQRGFEYGETRCLGFLEGDVRLMEGPEMEGLKIPHMGWNEVIVENDCLLSIGIEACDRFYYVHSYKAVTPMKNVSLYSEYGGVVPGLVYRNNVYGTQFHPEKSGAVGLKILHNFGEL